MRKTKLTIKPTTAFKKDYKLAIKRGLQIELLETVIETLAMGSTLPPENLSLIHIYSPAGETEEGRAQ